MIDENGEQMICKESGKICYSQREAGYILSKAKRKKYMGKNNNIPKRTYICEHCGYYHLTHLKYFFGTRKYYKQQKDRLKHYDFLRISKMKRR